MSDATYLVDALRDVAQYVQIGPCWKARRALARYEADLAAGRVPVIVDRETRDALELYVSEWHDQGLSRIAGEIVAAYDATTRDMQEPQPEGTP